MKNKTFIILFALTINHLIYASNSLKKFSKSPHWLKLLRYEETLLNTQQSLIKSKEYFLAKDGMTSAISELKETINAIESPNIKDMNNHAKCLFPARFLLLKKNQLISKNLSLDNCPAYQNYVKKVDLSSVSIIFSSYFIEKPASTFGHTFFRLRASSSVKQDNDLLDYGVDFSAKVDTINPLIYGLKGIFGGFKGMYSMMPYYIKVKEYNNMESRDLWDYELNLNSEERYYFQAHLFEMNRAYFDYLYFTKNCSYHILAFVDAIKPEWNLIDQLSIQVPPIDTIYALFNRPKIIKKIKLRPSSYTKLKTRYKKMDEAQSNLLKQLIEGSKDINKIEDVAKQLFVLDTYNLYIDFKNADVDATKSLKNRERRTYLAKKFQINSIRSKLNGPTNRVDYQFLNKDSPQKGHRTQRLGLIFNHDRNGDFLSLRYRPALHDLLDKKKGYLPMATTELLDLRIDYDRYQSDQLRLAEIKIAQIEAFRPVTAFAKKISWRFNFGFSENDIYKSKALSPYLGLDLGYSFGNENYLIATLLATKNNYINGSNYNYTLDYGPKLKAVIARDRLSIQSTFQFIYSNHSKYNKRYEWDNEARIHLTKDLSLFIGYHYQDQFYKKLITGANFFY